MEKSNLKYPVPSNTAPRSSERRSARFDEESCTCPEISLSVSEGSVNSSVVHPREVFAPALLYHAAAILVAHNHPSGDPKPSQEDKELTRSLNETGIIMGIPLIDHLVIGDGIFFSFREQGYLDK